MKTMKKVAMLLFSIILSTGLYSQTDTTTVKIGKKEIVKVIEGNDTLIVNVGRKGIKVIESEDGTSVDIINLDDFDASEEKDKKSPKNFNGHWKGLEIGMNNYLTSDYSLTLPAEAQFMELNTGKSWCVNLNLIQYDIGFRTDKIGLVTGMGLEFNNYRFDRENSIIKDPVTSEIVALEYDAGTYIEKSKLATTYLTAPLLLEFQIPVSGHKRIHISGGVIGGLKIGSHTKVIYKEDGTKQKDKIRDDFNLSPLRYGVTARIGYRALKIFAIYNLTPMFESAKGPELYPVSIGLILADF
ncbi:MAG: outer membrane beta-barrel protein [Bacteroidetes bacterium]|nr:outer membrane beta-barrel protein [Bacteroidota bacterium]